MNGPTAAKRPFSTRARRISSCPSEYESMRRGGCSRRTRTSDVSISLGQPVLETSTMPETAGYGIGVGVGMGVAVGSGVAVGTAVGGGSAVAVGSGAGVAVAVGDAGGGAAVGTVVGDSVEVGSEPQPISVALATTASSMTMRKWSSLRFISSPLVLWSETTTSRRAPCFAREAVRRKGPLPRR